MSSRTFSEYPLVVEVRHSSWLAPEFMRTLEEEGVGFVNIDQPLYHDSIKPSAHATSRVGYVRVHGRNYKDWFREKARRRAAVQLPLQGRRAGAVGRAGPRDRGRSSDTGGVRRHQQPLQGEGGGERPDDEVDAHRRDGPGAPVESSKPTVRRSMASSSRRMMTAPPRIFVDRKALRALGLSPGSALIARLSQFAVQGTWGFARSLFGFWLQERSLRPRTNSSRTGTANTALRHN